MISQFTVRRHLECSCDRRRDWTARTDRTEGKHSKLRSETATASDKSPSSGYSSQDSNNEEQSGAQTDTLLIDLSSPGREETWEDINIIHAEGDGEDKARDLSFTDIALRKTGVAMLSQLPQHASSLQIDSFVPTELTVPSVPALKGAVSALSSLIAIIKTNKCFLLSQWSGLGWPLKNL